MEMLMNGASDFFLSLFFALALLAGGVAHYLLCLLFIFHDYFFVFGRHTHTQTVHPPSIPV
jgi:hypothetical protein